MKITDVRTAVVWAPRRAVYGRTPATALGDHGHSEHAVVFVDTDEGINGVGEICSVFSRRGRSLALDLELALKPVLLGADPMRIAHHVDAMDAALHGAEPAKAALEMALFDIAGKALGTPVYNLLGGMVRERIPLSFSIPFGSASEMAEYGRARAAEGFRTVKVKVGQSPGQDIEAVARVRESVGPDVRVRVDANMAWRSAKEAIAIIREMEPYRPELIEQPLPARDLDALATVRDRVGVPIMVDESVWTPRDAMEVIRRGAADVVNVYVSEAGGLLNASRIFSMCHAAGLACMIGSMPELGIGTAAQIHLGLAMTNLDLDSDCCGSLYHDGDLLCEPLRFERGQAYPPPGAGLGVEVDMDVVERWSRAPG